VDDLLKWRGEFPILDRTTYMISNSLGAMPRAVYDEMRAYADSWAERGVRAWEEGWWEMAVSVGDKIAPLIGARPGEISLHQNVTLTQAVISSCFDFRGPRNKIVMVDLEFPSIQYFYHEQRRHGARVEVIPAEDSIRFNLEKLLAPLTKLPCSSRFRSSCFAALSSSTPAPSSSARIGSARTSFSTPSRLRQLFRWTCAPLAPILQSAVYSSGFAAVQASPIFTSAKICARN